MMRHLRDDERNVLLAMIERGEPWSDQPQVPVARRVRWRDAVPELRVSGACDCGMCPTVDLSSEAAVPSISEEGRVVLVASHNDATVLLVVDDDVPSCLELAPGDDATPHSRFPEPSALRF